MKKLLFFAVMGLTVLMVLLFAACGKIRLATPRSVSVDDNYTLSWWAVEDALIYTVEITNAESNEIILRTPREAFLSLSWLDEGEYSIRIKSSGDEVLTRQSDWSKAITFHKGYETGLVYRLINNQSEYEIAGAGTASGDIVIEDVYRGKPVTRIADSAFKSNRRITNLVIGNNVKYIADNAFYNSTGLETIVIPSSVTYIGSAAFYGCQNIESIVIPNSVTAIKDYAFAYCRQLESITLGNSIVSIGNSAFFNCSGLKSVVIPNSVASIEGYAFASATKLLSVTFGSGLKIIDEYAFYNCYVLTDITFSQDSSLQSLGQYAFAKCSVLKSIELPEGLVSIGYAAFYENTEMESVSIPQSVTSVETSAFDATKFYKDAIEAGEPFVYAGNWVVGRSDSIAATLETVTAATLRTGTVGIADRVFYNFKKLTGITLSSSVKIIGKYAFADNTLLWRIQTPGVTLIDKMAFYRCTILSNIILGSSLQRIGDSAFYGCSQLDNSGLGNSFIPSTVTSIGSYAFKNTRLWDKPDSQGIVYAGRWVVGYNKDNIGAVELKTDIVGVADYAFYRCTTLQSVQNLAYAKHIGRGAFSGCESLTTVVLGSDIRVIEDYTFYKCSSLFSITLPSRLLSIGRSAFYNCELLNGIDLTDSTVTKIGDYAFFGCTNMKDVQLGDTVEQIGNYAFYNCVSVTSLVIPGSLQTIGTRAFSNWEMLETLEIGFGITEIADWAFSASDSLKSIIIPDSVHTIGNYAFYNSKNVEQLILGEGIQVIGNYAFYGLENLSQIILPKSVTSIGSYAFKGCSSLSSVVISGEATEIGAHAFYGCSTLTIYTEAESAPDGWHARWNSSYRPVVYASVLSEDKTYVVSITVTQDNLSNDKAINGISAPVREDFTFLGWSSDSSSQTAEYTAGNIADAPSGTVLYAVWAQD